MSNKRQVKKFELVDSSISTVSELKTVNTDYFSFSFSFSFLSLFSFSSFSILGT